MSVKHVGRGVNIQRRGMRRGERKRYETERDIYGERGSVKHGGRGVNILRKKLEAEIEGV